MSSTRVKPERIKEIMLLLLIIGTLVVFSLVIDNYMSGRFFNRVTQRRRGDRRAWRPGSRW